VKRWTAEQIEQRRLELAALDERNLTMGFAIPGATVKMKSKITYPNGLDSVAAEAIEHAGEVWGFARGIDWNSTRNDKQGAIAVANNLKSRLEELGYVVAVSSKFTTADAIALQVFGRSAPVADDDDTE
jgi:hypothetical protein